MERKKPRKERRHKKSEEFEPFEGERRQRYEQVLKSLLDDYASLQKFLATFSGSCLVFSVTFLDKDHIPGAIKIAWVLWGLTIICVLLSLGLSILFLIHFFDMSNDSTPKKPQAIINIARGKDNPICNRKRTITEGTSFNQGKTRSYVPPKFTNIRDGKSNTSKNKTR